MNHIPPKKPTDSKAGLVFAADIDDLDTMVNVIKSIREYTIAIKLSPFSIFRNGLGLIEKIKKVSERPILVDLKLLDIPETIERTVKICVEAGADWVMIAGASGFDSTMMARDAMREGKLFVLTQLTHCREVLTDSTGNKTVQIALLCGANGVVVPGTRPDRIIHVRNKVGKEMEIMSCGIGAQGGDYGSAIKAGADYEIIGRAIYDSRYSSGTPEENAHRIFTCISNSSR